MTYHYIDIIIIYIIYIYIYIYMSNCDTNIFILVNTAKELFVWDSFITDFINKNLSGEFSSLAGNISSKFNDLLIQLSKDQIKRNIIYYMSLENFDNDIRDLIEFSNI